MTSHTVIFCTSTNRIIDDVSRYASGETALKTLSPHYGDNLIEIDLETAHARYEASFKSAPVEIDQQRYWDMLNVLPPVGWTCVGETESFKLVERTAGNVTSIFARIGDRCFEMSDSIFLKHDSIIACVVASAAYKTPSDGRQV